jgi:dTDP-4-dehydrorhamnose reductase
MKVLLSGGAGQLAMAVRRTWDLHELIVPDESSFNLGERESILRTVLEHRPQVVLNAGAFTQVDRCEAEPDLAMRINGLAPGWLAEACDQVGALLLQVSTDYVFAGDGRRPYREDDPTAPRSVYGRTKLAGEQAAMGARRHLIVRTAWLYDAWGANFYRTMINAAGQGRPLKVVDDQVGSPTTCRALARQLQVAVAEDWRGLVHGTCHGQTSWYGFTAEIFRRKGIQADLQPCSTADFPRPAPRPAYSVLDGSLRARLGTDLMPSWQEALAEVVAEDAHP